MTVKTDISGRCSNIVAFVNPVLVQFTMYLLGASGIFGVFGYFAMPHLHRPKNSLGQPVESGRAPTQKGMRKKMKKIVRSNILGATGILQSEKNKNQHDFNEEILQSGKKK